MIVDCMDCHADKSARNDRKSGFFKQDSRDCGGAVDFHRLQRILGFCDEKTSEAVQGAAAAGFFSKSLLCEQAQGSYLGGNDRRACEAIKDLSRKAESTSEKTILKEYK